MPQSGVLSGRQPGEDGLHLGTGEPPLQGLQLHGGLGPDVGAAKPQTQTPIEGAVLNLQDCSGEQPGVDAAVPGFDEEHLQIDSDSVLERLQDQLHEVMVCSLDIDLRDEAEDPGIEEILPLVRILAGVHTERGPAPVLGSTRILAEDLAPVTAEMKSIEQ